MRLTSKTLLVMFAIGCAGDTDKTDTTDGATDTTMTDGATDTTMTDGATDTTMTDGMTDTTDGTMSGDTGTPPPTDTVMVNFEEKTPPTLVGFDGANGTVVTDPTDATNNVGQIVKNSDAQTWAGTTIAYCDLNGSATMPLSKTDTSISVRVWSPDANTTWRLKAEDRTEPTESVETEAESKAAKTWETITFDFSNEASGTAALNTSFEFNKITIFPNFGGTGTETTYYFDDVTFLDEVFKNDCVAASTP